MSILQMILDLATQFGDGVYDAVGGFFGWVVGMFANFVLFVASALPSNPLDLAGMIQNAENWNNGIRWLNWFVPIGNIQLMLIAWTAATIAFYGARFVFRFIGDRFFCK